MGIAAYGPRNPVPPTLATRESLLRGAWEPRLQTAPQEPKRLTNKILLSVLMHERFS